MISNSFPPKKQNYVGAPANDTEEPDMISTPR